MNKFFSTFVLIGAISLLVDAAGASETRIELGTPARFQWTPASGPVDHYRVEIAFEPAPPFTWNTLDLTSADEPFIVITIAPNQEYWITIRTVAYDRMGNAGAPSPPSTTVHYVQPSVWAAAVPMDFDGDAVPDRLTHNALAGAVVLTESSTGDKVTTATEMGVEWEIVAHGDFDADGREDLFWRNALTGENRIWFEVGREMAEERFDAFPELARTDPAWRVLAAGYFDTDGHADLFWQNADTLETRLWFMDGTSARLVDFPSLRSASWVMEATGDFDGSGTNDLFWRNLDNGKTAVWLIDGEAVVFSNSALADRSLTEAHVVDDNDDGFADILWQRSDGSCELWWMSGGARLGTPLDRPCPAEE